jgi:hypothetical protein
MRLHDGRYECAYCGALLDIPLTDDPQVTIRAASGEPNTRALMLAGREIHACVLPADDEHHRELRRRAAALRSESAELRAKAAALQTGSPAVRE